MRRELEVADVVEGDGARRLRFGAPPLDESEQREVEEVVPGEHEELVVLQPRLLDREPEIPHGTEPVFVRRRPVVVHRHTVFGGPVLERAREAAIRDQNDLDGLAIFPSCPKGRPTQAGLQAQLALFCQERMG